MQYCEQFIFQDNFVELVEFCENYVKGTYPIKPPLPAVGGGEGVGQVLEARGCRTLKPGDWILPSVPMSGTWRSHAVYEEESVIPVR